MLTIPHIELTASCIWRDVRRHTTAESVTKPSIAWSSTACTLWCTGRGWGKTWGCSVACVAKSFLGARPCPFTDTWPRMTPMSTLSAPVQNVLTKLHQVSSMTGSLFVHYILRLRLLSSRPFKYCSTNNFQEARQVGTRHVQ